jgi:hypothetical protein
MTLLFVQELKEVPSALSILNDKFPRFKGEQPTTSNAGDWLRTPDTMTHRPVAPNENLCYNFITIKGGEKTKTSKVLRHGAKKNSEGCI